ncbi:MAG: hypothetical protein ABIR15_12580 [Chitinophagaceae bacterium]
MKIPGIIFLLLVNGNHLLIAQDSALLKQRTYRVTVYNTDKIKTRGWLNNITDSVLLLSDIPVRFGRTAAEPVSLTALNYRLLAEVKIKRKNGAARGLGIGFVCGFALGGIIGLASGDDKGTIVQFSAGEKALVGGLLAGVFVGGIGTIIGAVSGRRFHIAAKKENFDQLRISVFERAYRNN